MRRSAVKIKVSQIRELSKLQVTEREAAAFFDIQLKTFRELLRIDAAARQAWEDGREHGKTALRRKQFKLADTSAPMCIWLGKQYLNQVEVSRIEHSGRDGEPIKTLDLTRLDKDQRKDLRQILTAARVANKA